MKRRVVLTLEARLHVSSRQKEGSVKFVPRKTHYKVYADNQNVGRLDKWLTTDSEFRRVWPYFSDYGYGRKFAR